MISGRNLRHNTELVEPPETGKMINGQGLGRVSQLRYGICRMSWCGCEVIAVHNALVYLGMPRPIAEISRYMERFRVLVGFFGCNAYKLGKALEHFGAVCKRSKEPGEAKAFIITFWTGRVLMSSVHTVFCVREGGSIRVYNIFNTCPEARLYSSVEAFIGRHKPIVVYIIER
jgi:hypothetical protein